MKLYLYIVQAAFTGCKGSEKKNVNVGLASKGYSTGTSGEIIYQPDDLLSIEQPRARLLMYKIIQ